MVMLISRHFPIKTEILDRFCHIILFLVIIKIVPIAEIIISRTPLNKSFKRKLTIGPSILRHPFYVINDLLSESR